MNLKAILEDAAKKYKDKPAIIIGERHVSFSSLDKDANKVAHALMKMGIKRGDRVATIQGSNPEFAAIFFGIMKAGGKAVPLDSRYVAGELSILFNDCHPRALFIEDPPLESLLPVLKEFKSIEHIVTIDTKYDNQFTGYWQILADNPATPVNIATRPEDIAIISYTGGPTQKPHGVALSHRSIYTEVVNSAETFQQTEKDVMIQFALPTYHQFGLTAVLLGSLYKGNTVVEVTGTGRSIDSFMETVEKEKGTIYMGVPYIYSLMINVARRTGIKHDLSSLRLLVSGGAPLEPMVINQFKQLYGMNIIDIYGQTESVCHITVMPLDGSGKIGSSGKPMRCWQMKIFDDNDEELPPGHEGEIVVQGPVMTSFYNQPEATTRALRNGWLHTGDIGYLDEEGFLFITARKRRMMILKGQNVFPADIEEILETHPDIAEAKVMGKSDIVRSETIKAMVKLKPGKTLTEQEIRQYCQGRMADYKLPKDIIIADDLPAVTPVWRRQPNLELADIKLE